MFDPVPVAENFAVAQRIQGACARPESHRLFVGGSLHKDFAFEVEHREIDARIVVGLGDNAIDIRGDPFSESLVFASI